MPNPSGIRYNKLDEKCKTRKKRGGDAVRINRKNDYAFKRIFGHEDTKDVLAAFLTAVLGVRIKQDELTLVNTEMSPEFLMDKASSLDIHIRRSEHHEKMNVEMQIEDEHNLDCRIPYYWAKGYTEDLREGQNYRELPKMINIAVVDFDVFTWKDPEKFHGVFHIREDDENVRFSDKLEFHILELPKLRRIPIEKGKIWSPVECWCLYLNNIEGDIMEQIAEREPMIKRAMTVEDIFTQNARERELYEIREKGRRDYESAMIGREMRGMEKKALEVARSMLADGLPAETIRKYTGLEESAILSLR
jgi:predicted transposase/invertase (TIGR01784 family)